MFGDKSKNQAKALADLDQAWAALRDGIIPIVAGYYKRMVAETGGDKAAALVLATSFQTELFAMVKGPQPRARE